MDAMTEEKKLATYAKALLTRRTDGHPVLPFHEHHENLAPAPGNRKCKRKSFASLDLFTGAGGLALGLKWAGFAPAIAVERDADCCETFTTLFPAVPIEPKSVEEYNFRKFEGIDLIAGGPPCQPFSSGGKGLAAEDVRDMIPQFIRAVTEAKPRAFLMENVAALFGSTHQDYLNRVLSRLARQGYEISAAVLNAAEYGVPQKRRRGFIVGMRNGRFEFPKPTHGPRGDRPVVPVGTILGIGHVLGEPNCSKVSYAKAPDPRPSPYDGQLFNGGGRPINLAAPCHTVLASAGGNKTHFVDTLGLVPQYHAHLMRGGKPRTGSLPGGRRITPEESALIQTFPPAMKFHGARSSRYKQIGNAVPPLLASVIGDAIAMALG